ncbi:MAG: hypothetical protein WA705_00210 [Candidatus Ozemobacteraceae bacterium]
MTDELISLPQTAKLNALINAIMDAFFAIFGIGFIGLLSFHKVGLYPPTGYFMAWAVIAFFFLLKICTQPYRLEFTAQNIQVISLLIRTTIAYTDIIKIDLTKIHTRSRTVSLKNAAIHHIRAIAKTLINEKILPKIVCRDLLHSRKSRSTWSPWALPPILSALIATIFSSHITIWWLALPSEVWLNFISLLFLCPFYAFFKSLEPS